MIPLNERSSSKRVNDENELRQREINLRVAAPGIIQSFNAEEQTVTVQLSIREKEIMMVWRHGKICRSL